MDAGDVRLLDTPRGPARAELHRAGPDRGPGRGALVLGHGAGGGVHTADLLAVRDAALTLGVTVVLVEQPYRVAGRRAPAPAAHLDQAWTAVVELLTRQLAPRTPVVVGGRSSGARVACRTAAAVGARAVLCLAFPLVPPRAARATTRQPELDAVSVDVLVVQGARDPFGCPRSAPGREVIVVRGDHGLDADPAAVGAAVAAWLPAALSDGRSGRAAPR